ASFSLAFGSRSCSVSITVNDDPGFTQYGTPFAAVANRQDVVIYQVNIRAFSNQHNFKGVQERLDAIKALGVNVIYLMPVYPVGAEKSVNSPYCVKDFNSVNPEFGTLEDLRALVAAAHERKMAVILDWVANHTSWDNAWISNKTWYTQNASGNIISPANTGWNDVADLNFDNAEMRKAMIKSMKQWIYTANVDGYRCDAADFVPADFWKQAIDSLKGITTHKLLLLAEGTRTDHFIAGFQLKYGMGFYYYMVDKVYRDGRTAQSIDSVNTVEYASSNAASRVVRYTSNHDVNSSDGTPMQLLGGQKGSIAAFVAAAYSKSTPMIYNGQEVGCPVRLNFFNTSTTIDWTINPDVTAEYKKIIALRNANKAIREGAFTSQSTPDVFAFTRTVDNNKVWVLVNLRNNAVSYTVPAEMTNTSWKNAYDGTPVSVQQQVALAPYEYIVLSNQ
ncbi:MAG: alpha-amylase, partial [Sphingobacteriales bacterium]